MKAVTIYHYDSFTNQPGKGNPAGLCINGDNLSELEMQIIAHKVGFNEIAFPMNSDTADIKIRFFSPKREMDLCGHATIAAVYALKTMGHLSKKESLTIETKAGILTVTLSSATESDWFVTLTQTSPQFKPFNGSIKALTQSIGIEERDLDPNFPVLYGHTGSWTLLVPVRELAAFKHMKPKNQDFPTILKDYPDASIHPFSLETIHPSSDMHGRHFSSPGTGSIEDSVTGTASGAMAAYYAAYIADSFSGSTTLTIEQGQEMGKDGQVKATVSRQNDTDTITISGQAVFVKKFEVCIN